MGALAVIAVVVGGLVMLNRDEDDEPAQDTQATMTMAELESQITTMISDQYGSALKGIACAGNDLELKVGSTRECVLTLDGGTELTMTAEIDSVQGDQTHLTLGFPEHPTMTATIESLTNDVDSFVSFASSNLGKTVTLDINFVSTGNPENDDVRLDDDPAYVWVRSQARSECEGCGAEVLITDLQHASKRLVFDYDKQAFELAGDFVVTSVVGPHQGAMSVALKAVPEPGASEAPSANAAAGAKEQEVLNSLESILCAPGETLTKDLTDSPPLSIGATTVRQCEDPVGTVDTGAGTVYVWPSGDAFPDDNPGTDINETQLAFDHCTADDFAAFTGPDSETGQEPSPSEPRWAIVGAQQSTARQKALVGKMDAWIYCWGTEGGR